MSGISAPEKTLIRYLPLFSMLAGGLIFTFLFPSFSDLAGWFNGSLSGIPFMIWLSIGAVLGFVLGIIDIKRSKLLSKYGKRVGAGFLGWLVFSIMIAALTEEGDILQRLSSSPIFSAWAVLFFILVSVSPGAFGTMAFLTRRRLYLAGTVMMFFMLSLSCMVYSQASSATVISQDVILSVLFMWSMLLMVESINWTKRYVDREVEEFAPSPDGGSTATKLWRRQLTYTQIFIGAASVVAVLPFLIPSVYEPNILGFFDSYESSTMLGKAMISLLVLLPLMIYVFVRRQLDGRDSEAEDEDEVQ